MPIASTAPHAWCLLAALVAGLPGRGADAPCTIVFTDVTKETGITFVHTDGSSGMRYIAETVCCGVATFDYDNDGDHDIYFPNGAPLEGTVVRELPTHALYRNDGNWKFTDVSKAAGVALTAYVLGIAVADYDGDGHKDIFLDNFGPNILLRNNGNGTFTDVTARAGVGLGPHLGAGACFLDMDGDGRLDLYAARYVEFTYENHRIVRFNGHPAYVGPMDYRPTSDNLYRNNGDGTFADVSAERGIASAKGTGMGMVCADIDNDGDTDIIVGNDVAGNFLWVNDGKGFFEEQGLAAGLSYDFGGSPQATMGIDCGDFDNDGWLDFYATSYQQETATLYRNLRDGTFEDVTRVTGAGDGTLTPVTWGNAFADFDNDGDRDIFIATGHLHDNVELFDNVAAYEVRNVLLMNTGDGRFVNVSDRCGNGLLVARSSRGIACDDLDNDGDIDVVVLNSRREPTILRNDTPRSNHWLQIELRGVRTNRDGIGAHVTVVARDLTQLDEVHSGRGYQSHHGTRLHFGLGRRDRVDRVEVRWIGGGKEVIDKVPIDCLVVITEGTGRAETR
ncbi:MAG TPA: hypothetical protein DCM87_01540 [Planctomycetes bacterium]|nr:hypothetical protein [Planctomycetota bacterium]